VELAMIVHTKVTYDYNQPETLEPYRI